MLEEKDDSEVRASEFKPVGNDARVRVEELTVLSGGGAADGEIPAGNINIANTDGVDPRKDDEVISTSRSASADKCHIVEAVVEAAHELASHSAIPGVSEGARLVAMLVRMITKHEVLTVRWSGESGGAVRLFSCSSGRAR